MTAAERKAEKDALRDIETPETATAEPEAPKTATAEPEAPKTATAGPEAPKTATAEPEAPKAATIPLSVMNEEEIMRKAKDLGLLQKVQNLIVTEEQQKLQGALISRIKQAFSALSWPFATGEVANIRIKPENGDYTVFLRIISPGASISSPKAGNRVEVTSPAGEAETAESAAAYCRLHGLNPNGGSAVAFLRGKKYAVKSVAE